MDNSLPNFEPPRPTKKQLSLELSLGPGPSYPVEPETGPSYPAEPGKDFLSGPSHPSHPAESPETVTKDFLSLLKGKFKRRISDSGAVNSAGVAGQH